MYQLIFSNSFKKNYKLMQKRNYDMDLLSIVFAQLINTENVASKYKPHKLTGVLKAFESVMLSLIGCWFDLKTNRKEL